MVFFGAFRTTLRCEHTYPLIYSIDEVRSSAWHVIAAAAEPDTIGCIALLGGRVHVHTSARLETVQFACRARVHVKITEIVQFAHVLE
jgi:hypothetical protein